MDDDNDVKINFHLINCIPWAWVRVAALMPASVMHDTALSAVGLPRSPHSPLARSVVVMLL